MALILSLETSTKVCSVALHERGQLLALKESFVPNSHSELINLFMEEVLGEAGKVLSDLDAVAISSGPGSYTGLRIGTSAAKGLCFALEIPLLSVNTLQGLALQHVKWQIEEKTLLCPMIDARRMEVYCALYDHHAVEVRKPEARIIDERSFSETLSEQPVLFFGDGAVKCAEVIKHPNAKFWSDVMPSVSYFGQHIYDKYVKELYEDVAYFEPFYLKEFHTIPSKKNLLKT